MELNTTVKRNEALMGSERQEANIKSTRVTDLDTHHLGYEKKGNMGRHVAQTAMSRTSKLL